MTRVSCSGGVAVPAPVDAAGPPLGEEPLTATEAAPLGRARRRSGEAAHGTLEARAARAASDASATSRAAALLGCMSSPESFLASLQSLVRDVQLTQREGDAESSSARAESAHIQRDQQQTAAREAGDRASTDREIANIFGIIGSAIALAAGTVGAVFSGGATLVAAVGLAIAVLGPIVSGVLASEGVIPAEAALVATSISVAIGSAMSFGAAAAGGAAQIAAQAANVVVQVLNVAAGAAQVAAGAAMVAAACEDGTQGHRLADAEAHRMESDEAIDDLEEATEGASSLMRQCARVAERLRAVAEIRSEGARVALRTYA